jgi:hypothetical protein
MSRVSTEPDELASHEFVVRQSVRVATFSRAMNHLDAIFFLIATWTPFGGTRNMRYFFFLVIFTRVLLAPRGIATCHVDT